MRSLRDVLEELCPGVYERNKNAFAKRPDDVCMHGLKLSTCTCSTCVDIYKKQAIGGGK